MVSVLRLISVAELISVLYSMRDDVFLRLGNNSNIIMGF